MELQKINLKKDSNVSESELDILSQANSKDAALRAQMVKQLKERKKDVFSILRRGIQ